MEAQITEDITKKCMETNEHDNPKPTGFSKNNAKGKAHSSKSLPQEARQTSNNLTFQKALEKEEIKTPRVAAAAAKLLQSCPTLCDPRDGSPSGSPVPGILQARTLEWVAISFSNA